MNIPELRQVKKYLVAGEGLVRTLVVNLKIKHLCKDIPIVDITSVDSESIIRGLNRLIEVSKNKYFFSYVYSRKECKNNINKKDVNLVYFPAKANKRKRPFVVLSAGGAYNNVFSIAEGYPVATKLNDLGYPVFVLTYRVGGKGIFPKPLNDLAKALNHIKRNLDRYKIKDFTYVLFGFSAGGNLSALWGTDKHGYKVYGIKKPLALVLIYPVISIRLFKSKQIADILTKTMLNLKSKKAKEMKYNVDELVTKSYPPSYIVCCEDDNIVPTANSKSLKKRLDLLGILSVLEIGVGGGHGFGEGIGTSVEGWIKRADEFICKL